MFVWKDENKRKRGRGWPIFLKKLKDSHSRRYRFEGQLSNKVQLYVNDPERQIGLKMKKTMTTIEQSRTTSTAHSVTRLGDLLDFGQLFKAFGNN